MEKLKVKHLFRADDELWKEIRIFGIQNEMDANEALIHLIRKGLNGGN